MYARCGALPTASSYDYISYSSKAQEFIDITTPCASTWYFAVNSYSGSGVFHLTIGEGNDLTKCFVFDSQNYYSTAQKTAISDQIVKSASMFYGETLGGLLISRLIFANGNLSSTCVPSPGLPARAVDAMITDGCTGTVTAPNAGQMTLVIPGLTTCTSTSDAGVVSSTSQWSNNYPFVLPHELGHNVFMLPDEYQSNDACGHTMMGIPTLTNRASFCTSYAHRKDPATGQPAFVDPANTALSTEPFGNSSAGWDRIVYNHYGRHINVTPDAAGNVRMKPTFTPENYSYTDFDFNSYVVHVEKVALY